jgi:hypothetical protein
MVAYNDHRAVRQLVREALITAGAIQPWEVALRLAETAPYREDG